MVALYAEAVFDNIEFIEVVLLLLVLLLLRQVVLVVRDAWRRPR